MEHQNTTRQYPGASIQRSQHATRVPEMEPEHAINDPLALGGIVDTNGTTHVSSNASVMPDRVNIEPQEGQESGKEHSRVRQSSTTQAIPEEREAIAQPYVDDRNFPSSVAQNEKYIPDSQTKTDEGLETNHLGHPVMLPTPSGNTTSTTTVTTTTTTQQTSQVTEAATPTNITKQRRIPTELPPPVPLRHMDRTNESEILPLESGNTFYVSNIPQPEKYTDTGQVPVPFEPEQMPSLSSTESSSPSTTSITTTPTSTTVTPSPAETPAPTIAPTAAPTKAPTVVPTAAPTAAPTVAPTIVPTHQLPASIPELPAVKPVTNKTTAVAQSTTVPHTPAGPTVPGSSTSSPLKPLVTKLIPEATVILASKADKISSQVEMSTTGGANLLAPEDAPALTNRTMVIVVPIVLGVLAVALVGIILVFVYRRKRQHRKNNIIKYKRYSQNGEVVIPLTSVVNENYRFTPVSAHEEAIVYSQVDKTQVRPPRPTYRYKQIKTEDSPKPPKQSTLPDDPQTSVVSHTYSTVMPNETGTMLVDNVTYEDTPASENDPPKVPIRKASCDSQISSKRTPAAQRRTPGSPRRTPGSPRKEISWPIPIETPVMDGSPCDNAGSSSPRVAHIPPVPPPARRGASLGRPVPPSPRPALPSPPMSRPAPPTPPSPQMHQPSPSRRARHVYDPVYIPSSDAVAIGKRLDDAGYVTSRMMRMQALGRQAYEDVQVYSDLAQGSLPSTGIPSTPSSTRSPMGDATGSGSPASARALNESKSESDSNDPHSGDVSFDTLSSCNKVSFSIEDINKVIDDSFDVHSDSTEPAEVEYSTIPDDYSDNDNRTEKGDVEYSAIAEDYSDNDNPAEPSEVEYSAIADDYDDPGGNTKPVEVEYSAIPEDYNGSNNIINGMDSYVPVEDSGDEKEDVYEPVNF